MNTKPLILVVDDEEAIRKLLRARFERESFEVLVATQVTEALSALETHPNIAVVVTDVKMPGVDGLTFTKELKAKKKHPKVIVMTGHGEKSTAIDALRFGASDYLEKPFDMEEMVHSVTRTAREVQLERENEDFVQRLEARATRVEAKTGELPWFNSQSKAMAKVYDWIRVLKRESQGNAEEPTTIIIGESGTGKEGVAHMVHQNSRRANGAWIAVNCANFSETLLESELFGHEKGAFTGAVAQKRGLFELAKGGTLFLDELAEMDVKLQAKLLRVLQEKTFRRVGGQVDIATDVRVVAATNQNLERQIKEGSFRADLYHRLSKVVIQIPPLRERLEDIVPMANLFLAHTFKTRGKTFHGLTEAAHDAMRTYTWPGNVRELLNVVERTALLWEREGEVDVTDLGLPSVPQGTIPAMVPLDDVNPWKEQSEVTSSYTVLKRKWSETFEREFLAGLLEKHGGNVTAAAKEAALDRSNFLRLLRKHHINAAQYRGVKKAA